MLSSFIMTKANKWGRNSNSNCIILVSQSESKGSCQTVILVGLMHLPALKLVFSIVKYKRSPKFCTNKPEEQTRRNHKHQTDSKADECSWQQSVSVRDSVVWTLNFVYIKPLEQKNNVKPMSTKVISNQSGIITAFKQTCNQLANGSRC